MRLQGMFWNHKVLPCMVEKCGKYLFILGESCYKEKLGSVIIENNSFAVQPCSNADCMYLHDFGSQEDSFSKDELISAFERYQLLLRWLCFYQFNGSFVFGQYYIVT